MEQKIVGLTLSVNQESNEQQGNSLIKGLKAFGIDLYGLIHITSLHTDKDVKKLFHTIKQYGATSVLTGMGTDGREIVRLREYASREGLNFLKIECISGWNYNEHICILQSIMREEVLLIAMAKVKSL